MARIMQRSVTTCIAKTRAWHKRFGIAERFWRENRRCWNATLRRSVQESTKYWLETIWEQLEIKGASVKERRVAIVLLLLTARNTEPQTIREFSNCKTAIQSFNLMHMHIVDD